MREIIARGSILARGRAGVPGRLVAHLVEVSRSKEDKPLTRLAFHEDPNAAGALAHERGLYVIEDCAQAWCGPDWRGCEAADASLFSFGAIKTGTALRGALARVNSPQHLARMRTIQATYPLQSQRAFTRQLLKLTMLKGISSRILFGTLVAMGKAFGTSIDEILGGLTRGFSKGDLMAQLRHQPCAALLWLLRRRLGTYDVGRIAQRIANARHIISRLALADSHPELVDEGHSYWLFAYPTDDPDALITHLRHHGFDSTQRGRLEVVPPPADRSQLDCPQAHERLAGAVFLPCYPDMDLKSVDRMCDAIAA